MLAVLASLLLVALVNAQRPVPCETPPEWNGRQMTIDPEKKFAVFARISYDAPNERINIVEEVDIYQKEKKFYEYIILFKEGIMYQIELSTKRTGKCEKKKLSEPFHKFKIPDNATAIGEATIGSNALPGAGVNVAFFTGEIDGDRFFLTVTTEGCLPVHQNIETKTAGTMHIGYYDLELGVDPERFVPPRECE
ncbi:mammalian ependymin-related protein 1-like [Stylophora pistillata]|uniref:Mammalian ependymin-related protein 1 n=1 Tax=Stylophora pistillata TaxID=50429 RepID=A0A2B4S3F7_STYPI|nr:mammalian ependymin-related protein 1-like [Stylophora pistillata]PFX23310.1 Mammalian ependymin-related protein 1 [Stylophora pistillata]